MPTWLQSKNPTWIIPGKHHKTQYFFFLFFHWTAENTELEKSKCPRSPAIRVPNSVCRDCLGKKRKQNKNDSQLLLKKSEQLATWVVLPTVAMSSSWAGGPTVHQPRRSSHTISTFHIFSPQQRREFYCQPHCGGWGLASPNRTRRLPEDNNRLRALPARLSLSENQGVSMAALKESLDSSTHGCGDGFWGYQTRRGGT